MSAVQRTETLPEWRLLPHLLFGVAFTELERQRLCLRDNTQPSMQMEGERPRNRSWSSPAGDEKEASPHRATLARGKAPPPGNIYRWTFAPSRIHTYRNSRSSTLHSSTISRESPYEVSRSRRQDAPLKCRLRPVHEIVRRQLPRSVADSGIVRFLRSAGCPIPSPAFPWPALLAALSGTCRRPRREAARPPSLLEQTG